MNRERKSATTNGGAGEHDGDGAVGDGIRARRKEAGLSLRALAGAVGVSPSLISQIERGRATPSLGTLYAIASRLGVSMDELFGDPPRGASEASGEGPVLRVADRPSLTLDSGVRWERLTARRDDRVGFLHCTYPADSESCPADDLISHPGAEYGIVLEGRLGVTVGGASYELSPGDSIAFDARLPHRIWAVGDGAAIAVWAAVGPRGHPGFR